MDGSGTGSDVIHAGGRTSCENRWTASRRIRHRPANPMNGGFHGSATGDRPLLDTVTDRHVWNRLRSTIPKSTIIRLRYDMLNNATIDAAFSSPEPYHTKPLKGQGASRQPEATHTAQAFMVSSDVVTDKRKSEQMLAAARLQQSRGTN